MIEVKKPVPQSQVEDLQIQIEQQQAMINYLLQIAKGENPDLEEEQE